MSSFSQTFKCKYSDMVTSSILMALIQQKKFCTLNVGTDNFAMLLKSHYCYQILTQMRTTMNYR